MKPYSNPSGHKIGYNSEAWRKNLTQIGFKRIKIFHLVDAPTRNHITPYYLHLHIDFNMNTV